MLRPSRSERTSPAGASLEAYRAWRAAARRPPSADSRPFAPKHGFSIKLSSCLIDPDDRSKPFLFVRNQTRVVWNMAMNKSRVAVIGSPGIGKSFSIFYFLRLLMQKNQTFVFEARKWGRVYLFQPGSGAYTVGNVLLEHWAPGGCKELEVSQNHYVIDPDRAEGGKVVSVSANTIIAPSPDKGHLGEFGKTLQLVKLYNAPPSLEETLVYAGYFGVAGARTEELFQEFGGVLRKVLATDAQIMDHRKQRLSAIADKNLVKTFFESGVLAESEYAKPLSQLFLCRFCRRWVCKRVGKQV